MFSNTRLTTMHSFVYVIIWLSGVLYALWSFCKSARDVQHMLDPSDFKEGWTLLKRKKDVSDTEWNVLTSAFKAYWGLLCVHVIVAQFIKRKVVLMRFYVVYSICCLTFVFGTRVAAVYVLYILFMVAVSMTRLRILCYGFTMLSFYIFHHETFKVFRESIVPQSTEGFLIDVGFVWLAARSLSFAIDSIDAPPHFEHVELEFLWIFSYCLYLPVMFTGPLLDYKTFVDRLAFRNRKWTIRSFLKTILLFYKPVCGYFLLEFLLHFVYSSASQYHPDLLTKFDAWSICGLGYALPLLFYLKYLVIYSLCGTIAALEHLEFPPPPKCISWMHLPSLLWRNFDRGLYLWILKYLYLPIMEQTWYFGKKLAALVVCFLFISLWHGKDEAICLWAALNFLGVVIEMSVTYTLSTDVLKTYKAAQSMICRNTLNALISTPQFMMMCLSSVVFLSNIEVGRLVFKRILFGGIIPLIPVAAVMYCGCHASLFVQKLEHKAS